MDSIFPYGCWHFSLVTGLAPWNTRQLCPKPQELIQVNGLAASAKAVNKKQIYPKFESMVVVGYTTRYFV